MDEQVKLGCNLECSTDKLSSKTLLKVKSWIRPFVTYSWHIFTIVVLLAYFVHYIKFIDRDIVEDILLIELTIIVFWFGERTIRNIGITDLLKRFTKGGKDESNSRKRD